MRSRRRGGGGGGGVRVRSLARKEAVIAAANDFPSSLLLCHFHSSLGTCVGRSRNRVQTIIWVPVQLLSSEELGNFSYFSYSYHYKELAQEVKM